MTTARAGYLDELAAANIPTDVDAIKAKTDNLPASPASSDNVSSAESNIRGADSDTLKTLSDQIDAVPTVGEIDTELTAQHGSGNWTRDAGTGGTARTYTVTVGGVPLDGVTVWVTTDEAGANVIANGTTNASGIFTFYHDLAAGTTVYVWRQKSAYNFVNPDQETI